MEKTIEGDISIRNVVNRVVDQDVINEVSVPVDAQVQVQGSEATVVEDIVDPVVVNVEQV